MKLLMENWRKFLNEMSLQYISSLADAYNKLGVQQGDKAAAKTAYRKIAMANHPDKVGNDPKKIELFKIATEAWDVIENPKKYSGRDWATGEAARPTPASPQDLKAAINKLGRRTTAAFGSVAQKLAQGKGIAFQGSSLPNMHSAPEVTLAELQTILEFYRVKFPEEINIVKRAIGNLPEKFVLSAKDKIPLKDADLSDVKKWFGNFAGPGTAKAEPEKTTKSTQEKPAHDPYADQYSAPKSTSTGKAPKSTDGYDLSQYTSAVPASQMPRRGWSEE